jgi:hypothetical protein
VSTFGMCYPHESSRHLRETIIGRASWPVYFAVGTRAERAIKRSSSEQVELLDLNEMDDQELRSFGKFVRSVTV